MNLVVCVVTDGMTNDEIVAAMMDAADQVEKLYGRAVADSITFIPVKEVDDDNDDTD